EEARGIRAEPHDLGPHRIQAAARVGGLVFTFHMAPGDPVLPANGDRRIPREHPMQLRMDPAPATAAERAEARESQFQPHQFLGVPDPEARDDTAVGSIPEAGSGLKSSRYEGIAVVGAEPGRNADRD